MTQAQAFAPPPYLTDAMSPLFPGLEVRRVESLPPEAGVTASVAGNEALAVRSWAEHLVMPAGSSLRSLGTFGAQGSGRRAGLDMAAVRSDRATYLGFHPDKAGAKRILTELAQTLGLSVSDQGPDVRIRRTETQLFVTNYGQEPAQWADGGAPIIGQNPIPPGAAAVFGLG